MKKTQIFQILAVLAVLFTVSVSAFFYFDSHKIVPEPLSEKMQALLQEKPEVVLALPNAETEVNNKIVVTFNQPMTSLSSLDEDDTKNIPLEITPKIEGKFRWLGTSSITFIPNDRFAYATSYTVTIPAETKNIAGVPLGEDFQFSFQTPRADIEDIKVVLEDSEQTYALNNYQYMYEKQVIDLIFNQDIKITDLEKNIVLTKQFQPSLVDKKITEESKNVQNSQPEIIEEEQELTFALSYQKNDGEKIQNHVVLYPKENWDNQYSYRLKILPGIVSLEGDLVLSNKQISPDALEDDQTKKNEITQEDLDLEKVFTFSAAPKFTVSQVLPSDKTTVLTSLYSNSTEIEIHFSSPMREDNFLKNIHINPELDSFDTDAFVYFSGNSNIYRTHWDLNPSTQYTVTLSKNLPDAFGRTLGEDYSWTFTTAALKPNLYLDTKGKDFGVFESGIPPMYQMNYVNIKKVNLQLVKLSLQDVLRIQDQKKVDWDFQINPSNYQMLKTWSLEIPENINEVTKQNIEIGEYLHDFDSGIFLLDVSSAEVINANNKIQHQTQIFSLTPYALTVKYSKNKIFVYASNIQTAQPIEKMDITIFSLDGKAQYKGQTNEEGITEIPVELSKLTTKKRSWDYSFFVQGAKNGTTVFVGSDWDEEISPWKFGLSTQYNYPEQKDVRIMGKIYTDRPLYKPGETIYFKGLVRNFDRENFSIPVNQKITLRIKDNDWNEVFVQDYKISSFGGFDGEFAIPSDVKYGNFTLEAQFTEDNVNTGEGIFTNVMVTHFQKAPFKVAIETEQEEYVWGDEVKGIVKAESFFGAPLSHQKIDLDVSSTDYYFNRYQGEWFSFSTVGNWCYWYCNRSNHHIFSDTKTLNAQGETDFNFTIQSKEDESDPVKLSQVYTISSRVFDEKSDQEVSGRKEIIAHFSDWYLGVKIDEYMIQSGDDVSFKAVSVNKDGTVKAKQTFEAELVQREYKTIKKKGVDGSFYYENETKDTLISSKTVSTDENGKFQGSFPVTKGGSHIIRVKADSRGNEIIAESEFWVSGRESISWPKSNHDRIDIIADKQEYKVGDVAKLLIKSPYTKATALVTIEQDSVIDSYVFDLKSNAETIELKIKEEHLPNVYVSVILQKPRTSLNVYDEETRRDTGQAEFKIGYIKLPVEVSRKELTVNVSAEKESYLPQEDVTLNLDVKDFEGKGVKSDIAIMVVDLSLLALTGYEKPDIVKEFYSERGLGVSTALTFTKFIERFKPGAKGGSGGSDDTKARGEFKNTAYWIASITSDENGKATTTFKLPDNLTTWKVTAIVQDKQNRFGSGDSEFLETKRLIIQPSLPQFFNASDEVEVKTVVINRQNKALKSKVTLELEGAELIGNKEQEIALDKNGRETVLFTIKAGEEGEMNLKFAVEEINEELEKNKDVLIETRKINRLVTEEVVATSAQVIGSATESVFVPKEIISDLGSLDISVSATLAYLLPKNLQLLSSYPYQCTEQTISQIFPNILVLENSLLQNIFNKDEKKKIQNQITAGLTKIYESQSGDGSWGYFASSLKYRDYLSAYTLIALEEMKMSGKEIDKNVLTKARKYLSDRKNNEDLITQGFVRWALSYSQGSSSDSEYARNILASEDTKGGLKDLPYFAYIYWALSAQDANLLKPVLEAVQQTDRGAFVEEKNNNALYWSTSKRTTALTLYALQILDSEHPYIPKLLRYLNNNRNHQGYGNTQENVWTLLALIRGIEAQKLDETDERVSVNISSKEVLHLQFDAEKKINLDQKEDESDSIFGPFEVAQFTQPLTDLEKEKDILVSFEQKGKGDLYYDMQLSYFIPVKDVKAREEGFSILREMYSLEGEKLKSFPKVGETFKIKLTIVAPAEGNFVAVEDFIPAGVIPINTSFQTEDQSLEENLNQSSNNFDWWKNQALRYFQHVEFRDDRVFLFAEYLPAGVYEYEYAARVSHSGTFNYLPARVFEMYDEDRFGRTKGEEVIIH